ncbi:MAG: hypothetical protein U5K38_14325 [Woeseiaceae bacterium]|nr:hypothetical protein [Woeseiaceae bacterium]
MATAKSTTAVVAGYNKAARALGRRPVKRFADRRTALRRVRAIETEVRPASSPPGRSAPGPVRRKRGLRFDLHRKDKVPRARAPCSDLLEILREAGKKGIDFEDLHTACGFKNRKSTRDALGLLWCKNGYAISGPDACVRLA